RPERASSRTRGSTSSRPPRVRNAGSRSVSASSASCRSQQSVSCWPARGPLVRIADMRRQRLRPLTEAEAYARCHGTRDSEVRIVKLEPRRPRYDLEVSGEDLRRSFEAKLAGRELEDEAITGTA